MPAAIRFCRRCALIFSDAAGLHYTSFSRAYHIFQRHAAAAAAYADISQRLLSLSLPDIAIAAD